MNMFSWRRREIFVPDQDLHRDSQSTCSALRFLLQSCCCCSSRDAKRCLCHRRFSSQVSICSHATQSGLKHDNIFLLFPRLKWKKTFPRKKGNWTLGGVNRVVHQIKNQAKIYQESSGQSFPGASEERSKIMKKVIPGLLLCGQRKNTMMKRAP